ncbi:MAG: WXG100 family type VII secretion target [Deltaproteobacteria bacterium]|jgi:WXG100 family type VII secretion target|nr:WXG100 family type VII secretion target [Deltaproteobacteria bacterium]
MALSTVNLQKMKGVATELEKIYASMGNNKKKLDELMARLPKMWTGEGSQAYQKAYQENSRNFQLLAEAIRGCSEALTSSVNTYSKADLAASEAIKAKMAKG